MSSKKSPTIGFRYFMGMHIVICHGPVDKISEIIIGERTAWSGEVTTSSTININKPDLFGGETREGGVIGDIDFAFGEKTQGTNSYLASKIGGVVPAFRGVLAGVFRSGTRGFMWSAMNPYFKAPWFRVTRVLKGWSQGTEWYPSKAYIGTLDMNPAHMIYECFTNREWGNGRQPSEIDDANFKAVADQLYAEGFGLSMVWSTEDSIGSFIDDILRHVDGVRRYNMKTGKLQIKLIRGDYDPAMLPELNPSNCEVSSFQRTTWGDMTNEVTVTYTDRDQNTVPITLHNLAAIEAQGGEVVSTTKAYPGIRERELASRVCSRDLVTASTPSAKATIVCNRVAWDWFEGDVFKLSWPLLGVSSMVMRVIKIDKGQIGSGRITIEAIEDVFSTPSFGVIGSTGSGWQDPRTAPTPILNQRLIESPYWEVVRGLSAADFDYLQPGWAFGQVLAAKPAPGASSFHMYEINPTGNYDKVGTGVFCPSAILGAAISIGAAEITVPFTSMVDGWLIDPGEYVYIDDEAFGVVSISLTTSQVTLSRGVLDTVPAAHSSGSRMYFVPDVMGSVDPTERAGGENTSYRCTTVTALGVLPVDSATTMSLMLPGRARRAYPPGNLRINTVAYPASVPAASGVVVSWSHRDRTQQTVSLVPTTAGNIGPEPGVTYRLKVSEVGGGTLGEYTGVTSPYTIPPAISSVPRRVKIEVWSVKDSETSWQAVNHSFDITS